MSEIVMNIKDLPLEEFLDEEDRLRGIFRRTTEERARLRKCVALIDEYHNHRHSQTLWAWFHKGRNAREEARLLEKLDVPKQWVEKVQRISTECFEMCELVRRTIVENQND